MAKARGFRLAEVGRELGIPVLDLLPILREAHASANGELFYDHCHPTPRGNEIVAASILDFLHRSAEL